MMPNMLEGSGEEAVQAGQLGHRQDSFIQQGLTHRLLRLLKSGLQIRIRIQSGQWIEIPIRNPDPDPKGQKWPTKVEKIWKISCF